MKVPRRAGAGLPDPAREDAEEDSPCRVDWLQRSGVATLAAIRAIPLSSVNVPIQWLCRARAAGRRIFVCGNGGSAATEHRTLSAIW